MGCHQQNYTVRKDDEKPLDWRKQDLKLIKFDGIEMSSYCSFGV